MCLLTYIIYVFNLHIYIGSILGHHPVGACTKELTSALLLLLACSEAYSNRRGEYHKYPVSIKYHT